jgi:post-segregation antitoxin (ccd killing protein)
MTKLELSIEVPDQLARDARDAGLLAPDALAEMLQAGIRRKALERIEAARNRAGPGKPMSLSDIQEVVDSVRKRRA